MPFPFAFSAFARRSFLPLALFLLSALGANAETTWAGLASKYARQQARQKPVKPADGKGSQTKVPITGAFGLSFGERVAPGRIVAIREADILQQFAPQDPLPPLDTYLVFLLPFTQRVCMVQASTITDDKRLAEAIRSILTTRYGPGAEKSKEGARTRWTWSNGTKGVCLSEEGRSVSVLYFDNALYAEGAAEMKQRKAANLPVPPLGGPPGMRYISFQGVGGINLGQVIAPPEDATLSAEGLDFEVTPPNPVPGFEEYDVIASPKEKRVVQIDFKRKGMTPAVTTQVLADLVARFGPSSVIASSESKGVRSFSCRWSQTESDGSSRDLMASWDANTFSLSLEDGELHAKSQAEAAATTPKKK